jgi:AsmA family protein
MQSSLRVRRVLIGTAALLAVLIFIGAGFVAAVDAGYFRGAFTRFLATRSGRPIVIGGALEAHLFSLHPRMTAERVTIGNPPWTPAGTTAEIGKISLVMQAPWFGRSFGIDRLEMDEATFYPVRDATGHANWQWTDPDKAAGKTMPIIRSLSVPKAHMVLDDARRHLQFDGTVSAREVAAAEAGTQALRIEGSGQLNGRAVSFEITGDPLGTASHDRPYHFTFAERSSGSSLNARGFLPRPFDFGALDANFDAAGEDLKDLYFLTGTTLVNTGAYRLAGKFERRGTHSEFSELAVTSGQSDTSGRVSIDSSSNRPKIDAELSSQFLRLSDLGERAAGRAPAPETAVPLLLSDAMLRPSAVRHGEALVKFRARRLEVGRILLSAVSAKLTIDHGVLTVAPLLADVLDGKLAMHLKFDARTDTPAVTADLKLSDLQLGQVDHKGSGPAPLEGLMQGRVLITGHGSSVHQVAASANGTVTAALPHGTMRASLAELTGIDLRGLGLLLSKSKQEDEVRCAAASFQARDGTLTAQTLVLDTEPVLITGEGLIHMDTETLDLTLRGHPKSLRILRLRAPVAVRGHLSHPSIVIEGEHPTLKIVDLGHAKDADCAALLAGLP